MRKWLVEETGEVRCPKEGEAYWSFLGFSIATLTFTGNQWPILRVTEITDREDTPLSDRLDEWNW